MKREELIAAFSQLGKLMLALGKEEAWSDFSTGVTENEYLSLQNLINKQFFYNGWFTKKSVNQSLRAYGEMLEKEKLESWLSRYTFSENPKKVGLIMAGNIPLVGFHDFLSVLLSGNIAVCKLSSDDKTLLPALAFHLTQFLPPIKERIIFSTGKIGEIDAVIATGSDNSVKYFEQYFGNYPHIFRRNRTSLAVLNGNETKEDFAALGHDIFDYFGLGCRNVSHLLIPSGFDLNRFFEGIIKHSEVINHNKYGNNYDYNKAIFLMNQHILFDNNFVLLRESKELFSPLSMLHYQYYNSKEEVENYLKVHQDQIQVVVGKAYVPFGKAQRPELDDYADGVDTMLFLSELKIEN